MPTTILICGSPADGFQVVGLFADSGDAESYAEDHSLRDWWVAELTSPEAFAEKPAATASSTARCELVVMSQRASPLSRKSEERKADMQGIEKDDAEMSFRRGYQQGVIEVFYALERSLDPATRDVLQAWIEKDIYVWRIKAMLGYPPVWRLKMLAGPRSAGAAL